MTSFPHNPVNIQLSLPQTHTLLKFNLGSPIHSGEAQKRERGAKTKLAQRYRQYLQSSNLSARQSIS